VFWLFTDVVNRSPEARRNASKHLQHLTTVRAQTIFGSDAIIRVAMTWQFRRVAAIDVAIPPRRNQSLIRVCATEISRLQVSGVDYFYFYM
jgi:glycerol-3-phosphate O-acyltransferase